MCKKGILKAFFKIVLLRFLADLFTIISRLILKKDASILKKGINGYFPQIHYHLEVW
jgi:hypothetical protein